MVVRQACALLVGFNRVLDVGCDPVFSVDNAGPGESLQKYIRYIVRTSRCHTRTSTLTAGLRTLTGGSKELGESLGQHVECQA